MAQLPNIIEKERTLWSTIRFVFKESFKASKKYSTIRYITAILSSIFVVAQFGAFGIIVNEFVVYGIDGARFTILLQGFLLLLITQFGPSIIDIIHTYSWQVQQDDVSRYLQSMMFIKTGELDIGTIEQPEFQNIREIANNRGWSSFYNFLGLFSNTIRMVTKIAAALIGLVAIAPIAFSIIFIGALPTYFLERKGARITAQIHRDHSEEWRMWRVKTKPISDKDATIELKNLSLVKIFKNKFLEIIQSVHDIVKKDYRHRSMLEIASEIILLVSYSVAFFFLIRDVQSGVLAVGSLVFAFGLVTQFQGSLNTFFSNLGRMAEHKKNVDTMLDLFEMQPLVVSGERKIDIDAFESIEFKNVSFQYPGQSDRLVIQNLSLKIIKGQNLAIVGLNGAGKTTFLKLLIRVYDPTIGEILLNGINLKEYDLKSWKRCLAILLQEYSIYQEETIAENIMLGDTKKHDEKIMQQVAQHATADTFINELPDTYQQRVGTEFRGGVELSKGQKQKLALARVLYRQAPIIILDEPTAAIDALSEDTIFKALRENYNNQTRIIISHKFSNVRDADTIILIEHGQIIEQGSHDELMEHNGKYKELFMLQAEGYK
jgi:ABC-type multidrug transport system fused ATPase/permease subunit